MLNKIKIPLLLLHDPFYLLGNLWFEPLCLEAENVEDIQDFGHFLRLVHILKTGLAMQDFGPFPSFR